MLSDITSFSRSTKDRANIPDYYRFSLFAMLIRSPRRLVFLSFISFFFILAVLRKSPWSRSIVYEDITFLQNTPFRSGLPDFHPSTTPNPVRPPWMKSESNNGTARKYGVGVLKGEELKNYVKNILSRWGRPTWNGHWPPFADYVDKEYDPNRWEKFPL